MIAPAPTPTAAAPAVTRSANNAVTACWRLGAVSRTSRGKDPLLLTDLSCKKDVQCGPDRGYCSQRAKLFVGLSLSGRVISHAETLIGVVRRRQCCRRSPTSAPAGGGPCRGTRMELLDAVRLHRVLRSPLCLQ